jgi:methyltransferase (TIGR00027 family)
MRQFVAKDRETWVDIACKQADAFAAIPGNAKTERVSDVDFYFTRFQAAKMNEERSTVRGVSDTARWVAYFRALETKRPDALFRDPYAERLAGERGFHLADTLAEGNNHEWAWTARTYLFDQFVSREIREGAELVVNLAAGLDARPYRMELSSNLRWVEVDLPEIIAYKEQVLANEKPKCQLERISLDLSDVDGRRALFADLGGWGKNTVVMTEGLLIYFTEQEVIGLARDLAARENFRSWIIDLASPGQLKLMQSTTGKQLSEAGAAFQFGPYEGPDFFVAHGWRADDVQGLLKTAAEFKRSPARLLPLRTDGRRVPGNFPWTGVCLLKRP